MAKYGLRQVDLNLLVQLSLIGIVESPEQHLSDLLRSRQPIEDRTHKVLADALDGRSRGVRLTLQVTSESEALRTFRLNRRKLEIGRLVQSRPQGQSFSAAVAEVSRTSGKGPKTVESCHTLASKLDAWIRQCRVEGFPHSDAALEVAFIYSITTKIARNEAIKPSVEAFAQLIAEFERIAADASDIQPRVSHTR